MATISLATTFQKPVYIWKPDAMKPISEHDTCHRCHLYCAVALGTNDEHCDIRNQIQGMEVSFGAKKEVAIRRASRFNQLYKYLSVKEQDLAAAAAAEFTQGIGPRQMAAPDLPTSQFTHPTLIPWTRKGKKIAGCHDIAKTVQQGQWLRLKEFKICQH
ncbi:hypothetical protein BYT27DRAFT_7248275 [Phlegmacium glaucopus]|nr:hypothetical protein BYT27DRAFT_7248275 [Phlegmacium glaucopus]